MVAVLLSRVSTSSKKYLSRSCIVGLSVATIITLSLCLSYLALQKHNDDSEVGPWINVPWHPKEAPEKDLSNPLIEQDAEQSSDPPSVITSPQQLIDMTCQVFPSFANLIRDYGKTVPELVSPPEWLSEAMVSTEHTGCTLLPLPIPLLLQITADQLRHNLHKPILDPHFKPVAWLPAKRHVNPGERVCIRVFVPAPDNTHSNDKDPFLYQYKPFPDDKFQGTPPWWDTMTASLIHDSSSTVIPLHFAPWGGHAALRQRRRLDTNDGQTPGWFINVREMTEEHDLIHVYEAEVELSEPGTYHPEIRLEFQQAQWNFEDGPIRAYHQQLLQVLGSPGFEVVSPSSRTLKDVIHEHLALPLCTQADHRGRWLPVIDGIHADTLLTNRYHKFWAPYTCRYTRHTYEDFTKCIAHRYPKGLNMYGDSNTRRSIKKMVSLGHWCDKWEEKQEDVVSDDSQALPFPSHPTKWKWTKHSWLPRVCNCEDYSEPGWNLAWFDYSTVTSDLMRVKAGHDTAQIHYIKLDGLTPWNVHGWRSQFSDKNVKGNVVVLSLGNWDSAYMTLDEYNTELQEFINRIKTRYNDKKVTYVYRSPQYYCCRVDRSERHRRGSGPRLEAFHLLTKEQLVSQLNAVVWDVYALSEGETWEEKQDRLVCPANHVSADMVEVENQLLMNMLCN